MLEPVVRDAPTELRRLELSVRHLREKVKLYEELKHLGPDTVSGGDPFAEGRRELEAAHADADAQLKAMGDHFDQDCGRVHADGGRGHTPDGRRPTPGP